MNAGIFSMMVGTIFILLACLIFWATRSNKNISFLSWLSMVLTKATENIHESLATFYKRIIEAVKIGWLYVAMIISLYVGLFIIIGVWALLNYSVAVTVLAFITGAAWVLFVFGHFFKKMVRRILEQEGIN